MTETTSTGQKYDRATAVVVDSSGRRHRMGPVRGKRRKGELTNSQINRMIRRGGHIEIPLPGVGTVRLPQEPVGGKEKPNGYQPLRDFMLIDYSGSWAAPTEEQRAIVQEAAALETLRHTRADARENSNHAKQAIAAAMEAMLDRRLRMSGRAGPKETVSGAARTLMHERLREDRRLSGSASLSDVERALMRASGLTERLERGGAEEGSVIAQNSHLPGARTPGWPVYIEELAARGLLTDEDLSALPKAHDEHGHLHHNLVRAATGIVEKRENEARLNARSEYDRAVKAAASAGSSPDGSRSDLFEGLLGDDTQYKNLPAMAQVIGNGSGQHGPGKLTLAERTRLLLECESVSPGALLWAATRAVDDDLAAAAVELLGSLPELEHVLSRTEEGAPAHRAAKERIAASEARPAISNLSRLEWLRERLVDEPALLHNPVFMRGVLYESMLHQDMKLEDILPRPESGPYDALDSMDPDNRPDRWHVKVDEVIGRRGAVLPEEKRLSRDALEYKEYEEYSRRAIGNHHRYQGREPRWDSIDWESLDTDMSGGDVLISKREMAAVALAALAPQPPLAPHWARGSAPGVVAEIVSEAGSRFGDEDLPEDRAEELFRQADAAAAVAAALGDDYVSATLHKDIGYTAKRVEGIIFKRQPIPARLLESEPGRSLTDLQREIDQQQASLQGEAIARAAASAWMARQSGSFSYDPGSEYRTVNTLGRLRDPSFDAADREFHAAITAAGKAADDHTRRQLTELRTYAVRRATFLSS